MAIKWDNPEIISGDFHSVYSGSIFLYESSINTITFFDDTPGNGNTDKIVFEIKFSNDGNSPSLAITTDESRPGYVTVLIFNVTEILYGTLDFAQLPFLIDDKEYFMSFVVTTLTDKKVRLFTYSIFRKGAL